jgi:phosphoribosyl-ATP pyrophosphohydrolase/phosphoribosyl-AMP cyclohydrolase
MTDRMLRTPADLDGLSYDGQGLVAVVAQAADTGQVLMVAWANRVALERTLSTGQMHFWSRSRNELWPKGATSGNTQAVRSLHADCDGDTVLALVQPAGPACHTGETTCFGDAASPAGPVSSGEAGVAEASVPPEPQTAPADHPTPPAPPSAESGPPASASGANTLDALWDTLVSRAAAAPAGSYTTRLLADENLRLKKLGEENAELIHALAREDATRVREEAADVIYHLLAAILVAGVTLLQVQGELESRRNRPRTDG